jgi:hypothetical protein
MNKVIAIAALALLTGSAYAQLNPVPGNPFVPSPAGVNGDAAHWGAANKLAAYNYASDMYLSDPNTGNPDNRLGLHWKSTVGAGLNSIFTDPKLVSEGGSIRIIFLGESAGWLNDFGITYTGLPADGVSVFNNIQAAGGSPNITWGDYVDVTLGGGDINSFDFWLNASDSYDSSKPYPTPYGGYYTARFPGNSAPVVGAGNARWTQEPLMVNTYSDILGKDVNVSTYLLSFEDWRLDRGADADFNDFMVAIQLYDKNGNPFTPVPEPSTYGLIGAVALVGLMLRRRFSKK